MFLPEERGKKETGLQISQIGRKFSSVRKNIQGDFMKTIRLRFPKTTQL